MFETDRFIQDCCDGLRETNAHGAIRDIVARAVVEPREVLASLGDPGRPRQGRPARPVRLAGVHRPARGVAAKRVALPARPPDVGCDRDLQRARG